MTTKTKKGKQRTARDAQLSAVLGSRLRSYRMRAGITQDALADAAGYTSGATISSIETGEITPSLGRIEAMAKVLGVSPMKLMPWQSGRVNTPRQTPNGQSSVDKISDDVMKSAVQEAKRRALKMRIERLVPDIGEKDAETIYRFLAPRV